MSVLLFDDDDEIHGINDGGPTKQIFAKLYVENESILWAAYNITLG